jgi:hypothetical protein
MRQQVFFARISLVVWLAQALLAGGVAAQAAKPAPTTDAASGPSEQAKKEASGHFRSAVELYQEGAFRASLVEFQRAYEIAPDFRLFYNIGQAQLQVQDYLGASQSYERYLAEGGSQVAPERRTEVETALGALRERVARLSIRVNVEGAEVFVDDQRVGVAPLASTVSVNVGRHRVYARSADGTEGERIVDVAGGDLAQIEVDIVAKVAQPTVLASPEPQAQTQEKPPLSRKKRAAIASWGVAGATGIVAIVTGVMASGKNSDLDDELSIKPPQGEPDRSKVSDLRDSANTLALTTDILAGTALAAGATGLILWLVDRKKEPAPADAAPPAQSVSWGVGLGTVSLRGKF